MQEVILASIQSFFGGDRQPQGQPLDQPDTSGASSSSSQSGAGSAFGFVQQLRQTLNPPSRQARRENSDPVDHFIRAADRLRTSGNLGSALALLGATAPADATQPRPRRSRSNSCSPRGRRSKRSRSRPRSRRARSKRKSETQSDPPKEQATVIT